MENYIVLGCMAAVALYAAYKHFSGGSGNDKNNNLWKDQNYIDFNQRNKDDINKDKKWFEDNKPKTDNAPKTDNTPNPDISTTGVDDVD